MQVETPFNDAIVRKYPEQVVIVLAREKSGRVNPITLGWTMITSHVPPMMAFSVGVTRYSLGVLREAGECVIAFPSELQARETPSVFIQGSAGKRLALPLLWTLLLLLGMGKVEGMYAVVTQTNS